MQRFGSAVFAAGKSFPKPRSRYLHDLHFNPRANFSTDDLVVSLARECGLLLSSSTYSNMSMSPKAPPSERRSRQEQELNRMHSKADRATEKVRRMAVKTIEQHGGTLSGKVDQALGDLLLTCVASLESMLSDQASCSIYHCQWKC